MMVWMVHDLNFCVKMDGIIFLLSMNVINIIHKSPHSSPTLHPLFFFNPPTDINAFYFCHKRLITQNISDIIRG